MYVCVVGAQVLELASEGVFVPLTVGGGIRSHTDDTGKVIPCRPRPPCTVYCGNEIGRERVRVCGVAFDDI